MAQNRWVSTNFWKDTYVVDLDPTEKLLFLYLMTNARTNLLGIYEFSIREAAFDTGIDKDMVAKILDRLQRDHKVYYSHGWITMLNWLKHQSLNPKMKAGAQTLAEQVPNWYREELLELAKGAPKQMELGESNDRLSIDYDTQAHSILFNSILFNFIKSDSIPAEAGAPDGEGLKKTVQKTYSDAVQADEKLAERAAAAENRNGSGKSIDEIFGGK